MAKQTGIVLGREAVRQLGEMQRWWIKDYRNAPPPTRRQPVIHGDGDESFWAILTGKTSFLFETGNPPFGNRYRGEYSWVEAEEDPDNPGKYRPKDGGRFGIAGEVDAAHEINMSNCNAHLENMRVRMYVGRSVASSDIPASEQISSHYQEASSLFSNNIIYWFDLNLPREDGPGVKRYFLSHAEGNDQLS